MGLGNLRGDWLLMHVLISNTCATCVINVHSSSPRHRLHELVGQRCKEQNDCWFVGKTPQWHATYLFGAPCCDWWLVALVCYMVLVDYWRSTYMV